MSSFEYALIGPTQRKVSRLGMGCWAIGGHGWGSVDDNESIRAIRSAFERGTTLFDTADVYGFGHSETLLARALGDERRKVAISSKFGVRWDEGSRKTWRDISPKYMRMAVEASLRRLKLDTIPLYFVHWPDGKTPIWTVMAEMSRLRAEGKIGAVGVSNFSAAELQEATAVTVVDAVQVQYSIVNPEPALEVLPVCHAKGIPLITWGSLADGLLSGKFNPETRFDASDHRSRSENFKGRRFTAILGMVDAMHGIAQDLRMTVAQLSLRWVLETAGVAVALFGAKTESQVWENVDALGFRLTKNQYEQMVKLRDRFLGNSGAFAI